MAVFVGRGVAAFKHGEGVMAGPPGAAQGIAQAGLDRCLPRNKQAFGTFVVFVFKGGKGVEQHQFVVSTGNHRLAPRRKRRLALVLCPLREAEVDEVVGLLVVDLFDLGLHRGGIAFDAVSSTTPHHTADERRRRPDFRLLRKWTLVSRLQPKEAALRRHHRRGQRWRRLFECCPR